ncbi:MAG: DNA adenine methylase [Anaerolineae bacterium]|nr:DNA adenine methylase [Anaerolineae bacterium]CAG0970889.1 Modification methylase DpnIIA [Anaerolineae bacterium]
MSTVKSPLRYPGGKSRAVDRILAQVPDAIREYREPMVGGGSVFLAVKGVFRTRLSRYWINDLNFDLYCFWKSARDHNERLAGRIGELKGQYPQGRDLWRLLNEENPTRSDLERAVRFFILNRITFSGVVDSGGYSEQAFKSRFTDSAIERVRKLEPMLSGVQITHQDYEPVMSEPGVGVYIFIDPPYWKATGSRLYGVDGTLHTSFDHERFAQTAKDCPHQWLITYDDSDYIREQYQFAQITRWELQYGMNNYKQTSARKGGELFIRNY